MSSLPISENEFQAALFQLADLEGWIYFHPLKSANRDGKWRTATQGLVGFPDVVFAHPKKGYMFVELKSDGGRLTPEQKIWGATLKAAGANYFVWRPKDQADIDRILKYGPNKGQQK